MEPCDVSELEVKTGGVASVSSPAHFSQRAGSGGAE